MEHQTIEETRLMLYNFAVQCADAYVSNYMGDGRVMNQPVVIWNKSDKAFSWTSSLNPLNDDEVIAETIEEGIYGDTTGMTRQEIRTGITSLITDTVDVIDLMDRIGE